MLDLGLLGYEGEDTWQWQLRDQAGGLLAQYGVRLDQASAGFQLATDLYRQLWLLDAEPARRRRSERELLGRVGTYVAAEVLGPVGQVIASWAPVTVRVTVPPAAVGVLAIPLELADWGDGPLALHGAVFCYVPEARALCPQQPEPGSELRMLAVFARPETSSALGLVGERRALVRIAQDDPVARGEQPADLRVLQYGATKDSVRRSLGEADGWDVIHLAGHGGPGRALLGGRERGSGSGRGQRAAGLARAMPGADQARGPVGVRVGRGQGRAHPGSTPQACTAACYHCRDRPRL